ncbi:Uncharacterised protein [Moraxella lacunata]|uniref:Uncharacterized protein n=1 Tax=Moraxella lacunata TaxID=477 RepID=A0A378T6R8_MORLA|nr:Uncharacterised protein [Moraxella lacunata]
MVHLTHLIFTTSFVGTGFEYVYRALFLQGVLSTPLHH